MTLPLQTRSYTTDLYSYALSAIWQFWDRVRDPSYALAQDVDIWEIMRRDPKVRQGVQERLTSVAGPDYRVFAFNNSKNEIDTALATLVDDAFRFIPHFADARMRLAQSIFTGQSCELMTGKRRRMKLGNLPEENWWMFNQFKPIDYRRFTIRPVRETQDDGSTRVRGELYMSTIPMFSRPVDESDMRRSGGMSIQNYRRVEHPEWFVRVVYGDEEARLGYGDGLNNCIYFYHWIKQILLREGLQGVERWSQGIVVGTLDEDRQGATDSQTMENERAAMIDALSKMRSRHVYVQGKVDDIKVITGGGEGHDMVHKMLSYVDDCIMAVCTGAVLVSSKSGAGEAGSYGRDESGKKTQNKIIIADQIKHDEDMSTYGIGMWVRQNWALLRKYGLDRARMPQIRTLPPKEVNPSEFAGTLSSLWGVNPQFKVKEDEAYEKLGLTPPNNDDKFLVAPQAPEGAGSTDPMEMMMQGAPQQGAGAQDQGAQAPKPSPFRLVERMIDERISRQAPAAPQPITVNQAPITVNAPPVNVTVQQPAEKKRGIRGLLEKLSGQFKRGTA